MGTLVGVDEDDLEQRYLNLANYGLGSDRILALSRALKSISFINRLNLSNNRLTNDSVSALCASIGRKDRLVELNLSGNKLNHLSCDDLKNYVKGSVTIQKVGLFAT